MFLAIILALSLCACSVEGNEEKTNDYISVGYEGYVDGFEGQGKKSNIDLRLMKEIYDSVSNFEERNFCFKYFENKEKAQNTFSVFEYEFPEFFQFTMNGVEGGKTLWLGNLLVFYSFNYSVNEPNYILAKEKIDKIKTDVVNATANMDDQSKEKYIYDYIATNTDYSSSAAVDSTIYGVFINKRANCTGLTKAFKYLANACGLECVGLGGYTKDDLGHSWNKIKIGDSWYVVDLTEEVNLSSVTQGKNMLIYSRYNINDEKYDSRYNIDSVFESCPKADKEDKEYHKSNSTYVYESQTPSYEKIAQVLLEERACSVKCESEIAFNDFMENISKVQEQYFYLTGQSIAVSYYNINNEIAYISVDES